MSYSRFNIGGGLPGEFKCYTNILSQVVLDVTGLMAFSQSHNPKYVIIKDAVGKMLSLIPVASNTGRFGSVCQAGPPPRKLVAVWHIATLTYKALLDYLSIINWTFVPTYVCSTSVFKHIFWQMYVEPAARDLLLPLLAVSVITRAQSTCLWRHMLWHISSCSSPYWSSLRLLLYKANLC